VKLIRLARPAPSGALTCSIAARSYIDPAGEVPLLPGELTDATLIGAAELGFQPLLDEPRAWGARASVRG
jgi:hypothetical protein